MSSSQSWSKRKTVFVLISIALAFGVIAGVAFYYTANWAEYTVGDAVIAGTMAFAMMCYILIGGVFFTPRRQLVMDGDFMICYVSYKDLPSQSGGASNG